MPTTHTTPSINLVPLNLRVQSPVKAVSIIHSAFNIQHLSFALVALLATIAPATPALRWRADTPATKPYAATIYRGETITLAATLHAYNEPLPLPAGTTATLYYQTNGMHNLWWTIPGSATTNGTLAATFTPAHDTGAPTYNFFLSAEQHGTTTTRLYRAHGTITMRPSPGTLDGWRIQVEITADPVSTDSLGTIDYTLSGVTVRASCTPVGLTEAALLAALPALTARGTSTASPNDLTIAAPKPGLTVTLKHASLLTGPLAWGSATLRAGQIGFIAHRAFSSGTPGKLYEVKQTPGSE